MRLFVFCFSALSLTPCNSRPTTRLGTTATGLNFIRTLISKENNRTKLPEKSKNQQFSGAIQRKQANKQKLSPIPKLRFNH